MTRGAESGEDQVGSDERARAGEPVGGLLGLEEDHAPIALVRRRALDHGLLHDAELDLIGLSAGCEQGEGSDALEETTVRHG